jgi:hypothetical protein
MAAARGRDSALAFAPLSRNAVGDLAPQRGPIGLFAPQAAIGAFARSRLGLGAVAGDHQLDHRLDMRFIHADGYAGAATILP